MHLCPRRRAADEPDIDVRGKKADRGQGGPLLLWARNLRDLCDTDQNGLIAR